MHPTLMKITELLKSPPDEYRPYPFWFWNANLSREEITWQLEECRRQKIYTVLIHPRYGLVTPYLGEEFMRMVVHAVQEAARLGMKVWLYDEYNWPSGTVAGRLLRNFPHFKMKFLNYTCRKSEGNETIQRLWQENDFPGVQGIDLDSGNIRTFDSNEKLPPGRWELAEFRLVYPNLALDCVCGHSHAAVEQGYLDVLNPAAVAAFIGMTHEVYYKHLRDYFGSVILGFFTDEPGVIYDFDYSYDFGYAMTHNLPWTGSLEQHFLQIKGYSLREKLIHLIADTPGADKIRKDYWDVVSDLYITAYHRQLALWCKERGIAYTGHVVCEEMSLHYQGDIHTALKEFTIPGLDWTSKACTPESAPVYSTAKMVSSIAHRYGRKHTVCETYGATGWGLTLNDMKQILDFLYVLGVNQTCMHGFFYSVRGARAHECPPSEFFQSPWWKYMSIYSDYTARLGALLSQGHHYCSVGVLVPTRSYQAKNNHTYLDPAGKPTFYAQTLNQLYRYLIEDGIDFECIFDSALTGTSIDKQGIEWGDEWINTLIIPPSESLDSELQTKIDQFKLLGGQIIAVSDASDATRQMLRDKLNSHRVVLFENDVPSQGVLVHRRVLSDDSILCFACNASTNDHPDATLVFSESMQACEIDLDKMQFNNVRFSSQKGKTIIQTSFRPHQARMFLLTTQPAEISGTRIPLSGKAEIITPEPNWRITTEKENVLKISHFLHIHLPDTTRSEIHARVTCDERINPVRLLLEGNLYKKVTINHIDVTAHRRPCRYFDSDQFVIDITDHLRLGENLISMEYAPNLEDTFISGLMTCAGIQTIQPRVFLIGDFCVTPEHHLAKPVTTLKTGAWQEQGFPYYAGTITYQTTFSVPPMQMNSRVYLKCDVSNSCVEVIVNKIPCGTRAWEPYNVNITQALKTGINILELKVTNTAMDLLRPLSSEVNTDNPQAILRGNNTYYSPSGLISVSIEIEK